MLALRERLRSTSSALPQASSARPDARLDFVFSENGVHAFRGGKAHCKSTSMRKTRRARALRAARSARQHGRRRRRPRHLLERRQCATPPRSAARRRCRGGARRLRRRPRGRLENGSSPLNDEFGPATEFALTFSIGGRSASAAPSAGTRPSASASSPKASSPPSTSSATRPSPAAATTRSSSPRSRPPSRRPPTRRRWHRFWAATAYRRYNYATPEATVQLCRSCGRPSGKRRRVRHADGYAKCIAISGSGGQ